METREKYHKLNGNFNQKNQSKGAQRVHTSMKNERKSFAQKN